MTLQRLIVTFKPEETIIHALYRSDGRSNPGTKARRREVEQLARSGLRQALASLDEGDVTMCGASGFTQREDILSVGSPDAAKLVKDGAA